MKPAVISHCSRPFTTPLSFAFVLSPPNVAVIDGCALADRYCATLVTTPLDASLYSKNGPQRIKRGPKPNRLPGCRGRPRFGTLSPLASPKWLPKGLTH